MQSFGPAPAIFVWAKPEPKSEPKQCPTAQLFADPINPATGSVVNVERDCGTSTSLTSMEINRYYDSANTENTGMGAGWRTGYSRSIGVKRRTFDYTIHDPSNPDMSALFDDEAAACVTGFSQIQARVPSWSGVVASYENRVCVLRKSGHYVGRLPLYFSSTQYVIAPNPTANGYEVTRDDGERIQFGTAVNANGDFLAPAGVTLRLRQTASGYELRDQNDNVESYSATGRLLSITSRAGVVQTVSYDADGRLSSVLDSFGRSLTVGYTAESRILTATRNGSVTTYGYDAQGRLATVTQPGSTVRTYLYENAAFPHALTGLLDETNGRFSTWVYDTQGRAIRTYEAGNVGDTQLVYNADGSVQVTDALGAVRVVTFDRAGDRRVTTGISGSQCPTCTEGKATTYNDYGWVASRTDYNNVVTTYLYDNARGLETSRTEASGTPRARTITTVWHPTYRVPTQVDQPGRRTSFTHDANGNVLTQTVLDTALNTSRTWTYT